MTYKTRAERDSEAAEGLFNLIMKFINFVLDHGVISASVLYSIYVGLIAAYIYRQVDYSTLSAQYASVIHMPHIEFSEKYIKSITYEQWAHFGIFLFIMYIIIAVIWSVYKFRAAKNTRDDAKRSIALVAGMPVFIILIIVIIVFVGAMISGNRSPF